MLRGLEAPALSIQGWAPCETGPLSGARAARGGGRETVNPGRGPPSPARPLPLLCPGLPPPGVGAPPSRAEPPPSGPIPPCSAGGRKGGRRREQLSCLHFGRIRSPGSQFRALTSPPREPRSSLGASSSSSRRSRTQCPASPSGRLVSAEWESSGGSEPAVGAPPSTSWWLSRATLFPFSFINPSPSSSLHRTSHVGGRRREAERHSGLPFASGARPQEWLKLRFLRGRETGGHGRRLGNWQDGGIPAPPAHYGQGQSWGGRHHHPHGAPILPTKRYLRLQCHRAGAAGPPSLDPAT